MTAETPCTAAPPVRHYSPLAGFLSYLVPGLGQVYQGRIGKGLLFFCCLYGMFFYGMHLGQWNNVYLPPASDRAGGFKINGPGWLKSIVNDRLAFGGQFWIGVAAWPAIWHHYYDPAKGPPPSWAFWREFQRTPPEMPTDVPDWKGKSLNELQSQGDKGWDLGLICTVIAGVLNILVIYDAFAGPALVSGAGPPAREEKSNA